jgi:hypothetical protein
MYSIGMYWKGYTKYTLPNNVIHRTKDRPAIIYEDGTTVYAVNGAIHRDNDLPAVTTVHTTIDLNGLPTAMGNVHLILNSNIWFKHGKIHRDNDMPAAVGPSKSMWYVDGNRHRTDADGKPNIKFPAVVYIEADVTKAWFVNGLEYVVAHEKLISWVEHILSH